MKITLKLEHRSKTSKSIYYIILVDDKNFGLLRISDHVKYEYKGFFYHANNPDEIEHEELIEWLNPIVRKMKLRNDISHFKIKNS